MSIAFKDAWCQYHIKQFSLFKIDKLNTTLEGIEIKMNKNRELTLKVKCPICGGYHRYCYSINELVKREIIIGGCEVIGCPLFYIGDKSKVEVHINKINEVNRQVYAMI